MDRRDGGDGNNDNDWGGLYWKKKTLKKQSKKLRALSRSNPRLATSSEELHRPAHTSAHAAEAHRLHPSSTSPLSPPNPLSPVLYAKSTPHSRSTSPAPFPLTGQDHRIRSKSFKAVEPVFNFGENTLHSAARQNDCEKCAALIESGHKVSKRAGSLAQSPLHIACMHGSFEAASLLISMGADIDQRDNDGLTPLIYLAKYPQKSRTELMSLLLAAGCNPCAETILGHTALFFAATNKDKPILQLFLDHHIPGTFEVCHLLHMREMVRAYQEKQFDLHSHDYEPHHKHHHHPRQQQRQQQQQQQQQQNNAHRSGDGGDGARQEQGTSANSVADKKRDDAKGESARVRLRVDEAPELIDRKQELAS